MLGMAASTGGASFAAKSAFPLFLLDQLIGWHDALAHALSPGSQRQPLEGVLVG